MPINEGQIWLSHLVKMCMKCTYSMLNDKKEILILTYFYVGETGCMFQPVYHLLVEEKKVSWLCRTILRSGIALAQVSYPLYCLSSGSRGEGCTSI